MGKKNVKLFRESVVGGPLLGGPYICGGDRATTSQLYIDYVSAPKSREDDWRVEERFLNWGKPLTKINDDFGDWAQKLKQKYDEKKLEEELKELFIKDLHEQK